MGGDGGRAPRGESGWDRLRTAIEAFLLFVAPWISLTQWLSRDADPPVLLDQAIDNVREGKGVLRTPLSRLQVTVLVVVAILVLIALPALVIAAFGSCARI